MSDSGAGSDRYVAVPGDDPTRARDAVLAVRDAVAETDRQAALLVFVTPAAETATRQAVADVATPVALTVTVRVAADPEAAAAETVPGALDVLVTDTAGATARAARAAGVPVDALGSDRPVTHRPLRDGGGFGPFLVLLGLSYGFYLLLGDPTDPFDLVTGLAVGGLVAGLTASVAVEGDTRPTTALRRGLRATVFLPYLLWAIVRANVQIAAVILDPDLPVAPEVVTLDPGETGRTELAVLANAVTLTPGTLTVRAEDGRLTVHTLTPATRDELLGGAMVRAVAWVFHGRGGPRAPDATPGPGGDRA